MINYNGDILGILLGSTVINGWPYFDSILHMSSIDLIHHQSHKSDTKQIPSQHEHTAVDVDGRNPVTLGNYETV